MSRFTLHHGDSREILAGLAEASVDAIVCDPPYELGFMGKKWDGSGIAHDPVLWSECLRVAKPGAYLLAFVGTRTFHRLAVAIEDAGWELRDTDVRGHTPRPEDCPWLHGWMFGSGFPKSHNGEWGGTAQKPAWEPIVCARKPLIGTVEENWKAHGTGALNIDACRVSYADQADKESAAAAAAAEQRSRQAPNRNESHEWGMRQQAVTAEDFMRNTGRWPANLLHDGSDEVVALFPGQAGQAGQAGQLNTRNADKFRSTFGEFAGTPDAAFAPHDDLGSAARFFYAAKASKEDRNEGCQFIPPKQYSHDGRETPIDNAYQRNSSNSSNSSNSHPTVKPTDLMRYLCRLVTPKGGVILDPFMGSGSTGKAAMLEGFNFIGIDLSAEYIEIARARIEFALRQGHQPSLLEAA
jgi:site-specific DNA-methyltransferase (adenine-specific)